VKRFDKPKPFESRRDFNFPTDLRGQKLKIVKAQLAKQVPEMKAS
jgi:hypothetical protein